MRKHTLLAALFLFTSSAAFAQVGGGVQVGTTGAGVDFGYQFSDSLGGRIGYSGFNYSRKTHTSDVDYDAKLKLSSLRLLADWDLGAGFRVTGGVVYNNNKVDVTGQAANGTYTLNGNTYQASDIGNFTGRVKLGDGFAPYLGVGYGMIAKKGLGLYADLGVMYQGKAKTSLNVTCGSALNASQCTQLQNDAEVERQKVQDKLNGYNWYPVVSVGVSYAF